MNRIGCLALAAAAALLPAPSVAGGASPVRIVAIDFLTAREGYAFVTGGASGGALRMLETQDAGKSWSDAGRPPTGLPSPFSGLVQVSFATVSHGVVAISEGAGACQREWTAYTTSDGGRSWRRAGRIRGQDGPTSLAAGSEASAWLVNGSCAGAYAVLFAGARPLWAQASQFRSAASPAGDSPSAVSLVRSGAKQAFVAVAYPPWPGRAQVSRIQGYATSDAGASWRPAGASRLFGTVTAVALRSPQEELAVATLRGDAKASRPTLYVTRDGGGHWLRASGITLPADAQAALIQWVGAKVADVAADDEVWRSTDAGKTWRVLARVADE